MELIKVSIFLIAVGVPMVLSCSQEAVMNCVQGASQIGTMASSVAQDPRNVKKLCAEVTKLTNCMSNAIKTCPDDRKKQFQSMAASFAMANQMCDENDPCSMAQLLKCMEGFPMGAEEAQNADRKQLCDKLPKTSACMETMKASCQSSPYYSMLDQSTQQFPTMEAECKKMYGDDYASKKQEGTSTEKQEGTGTGKQEGTGTEKQGGTGTDDGNGNSGHVLGYSLLASLLALTASIILQ